MTPVCTSRELLCTRRKLVRSRRKPVHLSRKLVHISRKPAHNARKPVCTNRTLIRTRRKPVCTNRTLVRTRRKPIYIGRNPIHTRRSLTDISRKPIYNVRKPVHNVRNPICNRRNPVNIGRTPCPTALYAKLTKISQKGSRRMFHVPQTASEPRMATGFEFDAGTAWMSSRRWLCVSSQRNGQDSPFPNRHVVLHPVNQRPAQGQRGAAMLCGYAQIQRRLAHRHAPEAVDESDC